MRTPYLSALEVCSRRGHRRSQDFVCGVHFFTTLQKLLKIDSCSGWGVHLVSCGGALTHFPCKLNLKTIFSPPWGGRRCTHWGAGAPTAPPGYAYAKHQPLNAYQHQTLVTVDANRGFGFDLQLQSHSNKSYRCANNNKQRNTVTAIFFLNKLHTIHVTMILPINT